MRRSAAVGGTLLGVWLILEGLSSPPVNLSFTGFALVRGILALVAGILILLGR